LFFVYYRWTPEILNESKFFITKTNYTLQRLQQDEQTLCEKVADLHIAESSSLQLRRPSASSKQRSAAAKAESEAAASKAVAAALLQRRRRSASKKRRQRQRRAAAIVEVKATL